MTKASSKGYEISAVATDTAFSSAVLPFRQVPLNILWRVLVGSNDYMTTNSSAERNAFSSSSDGQILYVPKYQIDQTGPLYRLFQASSPPADHMESTSPNEANYSAEGILGYPWTNQSTVRGLTPMVRRYNGHDHATSYEGELFAAGYETIEGLGRYGYHRFNNESESLLWADPNGGEVSVASNAVAGGIVWHWIWQGTNFVAKSDYGREIQSSMSFVVKTGSGPNEEIGFLPTEGGDHFSHDGQLPNPADRHGSPILNIHNNGPVHVTRCIPLEYEPQNFGGGSETPVIYPDMVMGKDLLLNYNGMPRVAKYTSHFVLPSDLPDDTRPNFEIPTAYTPPEFNAYYTFDALNEDQPRRVYPTPNTCNPNDDNNNRIQWPVDGEIAAYSGYGGVILATADGSRAIGVYGGHRKVGGSVSYYTLWDFRACGTSKWSAASGPEGVTAGEKLFNTWIIVGTLNNVRDDMKTLALTLTK